MGDPKLPLVSGSFGESEALAAREFPASYVMGWFRREPRQ
jgi:hypothetical protein